jgi:predicted phage terminase large subunit-like protein
MTGRHPDFLVVDDSIKPRDAQQAGYIDAGMVREVSEWWNKTASTRASTAYTRRVVIGQRLIEGDLPGECLAAGYDGLVIPMEYDPEDPHLMKYAAPEDPRDVAGEILWPERFSAEGVARLKTALGPDASAQLQQNPKPRSGSLFKAFRRWAREERHDCVKLPDSFLSIVVSWDCAFKGKPESDRVAYGVWGFRDDAAYLLEHGAEQRTFTETVAWIESVSARWRSARVIVEDKANGTAAEDVLRGKVRVLLVEPVGGKIVRANAVAQSWFQQGRVFLPTDDVDPAICEFIRELERFPRYRWDDSVDQTSQALLWFDKHGSYHAALSLLGNGKKKT